MTNNKINSLPHGEIISHDIAKLIGDVFFLRFYDRQGNFTQEVSYKGYRNAVTAWKQAVKRVGKAQAPTAWIVLDGVAHRVEGF